ERDRIYEFGEFMLDPARRRLTRKGGQEVAITAKAFDALVYLVQHAGQTVQRAALAQALWPTVVVEDNNGSQTILTLRRTLGEVEGGPRYIVTIPRQGYRFVADVVDPTGRQATMLAEGALASPAGQTERSQPIRRSRGRWAAVVLGIALTTV